MSQEITYINGYNRIKHAQTMEWHHHPTLQMLPSVTPVSPTDEILLLLTSHQLHNFLKCKGSPSSHSPVITCVQIDTTCDDSDHADDHDYWRDQQFTSRFWATVTLVLPVVGNQK
jgi:hypothetical protein